MDRRLVDRLKCEAGLILDIAPSLRVILAELERRLGVRGWLGKPAAKLPLSNAAAARLAETVEAFWRQRLRHVTALPEFTHSPEPWRVMRSAGLSGSDLPMVRQEIGLRASTTACRADRQKRT